MTSPRASLIVSTWNGRHLLETCLPLLQRAVAQTGGGHEIIVVDDASTDGTVEYVARTFPDITLLALPHNLRFAGANNAAARIATGEILVFLNNDMLVEPDFLPPLLAPFDDPEVFAVTAHMQMTPRLVRGAMVRETGLVRGRFESGFLELRHEGPESLDPTPVIYAGGGSSAWRRDRFLELGGFDTLFRPFYFEDLDVSYRAQKHGWRVLFAPRSRMEHKHQQTNNPSNFPAGYVDLMFQKNTLLFTWKVLTDEDLVEAHFAALRQMLRRPEAHPTLAAGFLHAAAQLPQLLAHRRRARAGLTRTDAEVIAAAAGQPHLEAVEGGEIPLGSLGSGRRVLLLGRGPLPFEPARWVSAAGHRTWQLAQTLLDAGHQVVLAAERAPGGYEDEASRPPVLRLQGEHFTYYSMSPEAFADRGVLSRLCEQWAPEVIVAVEAFCGWAAARLPTEAPLWVDLPEYGMAQAQARAAQAGDGRALADAWRWEKTALERADAISVVSTRQKYAAVGELAALGRLSASNYGEDMVHYLPSAVEPLRPRHHRTVLRGRVVGEGDFALLWSGGFDAGTDVETLFEGLTATMREEPRVRFVSVGGPLPGEEAARFRFRQLIDGSEFADRFLFPDWVPAQDLLDCYAECDAGLSVDRPSYGALLGCRYPLVDMLRSGLPVVTSLGTELSHIVRTERLGVTFAAGDAAGLKRAVLELTRDESLRRRCATRAKEWVLKHRQVEQVMVPLREWMQAPSRSSSPVPEPEAESVWQPRSGLGRFARAWETRGARSALRELARDAVASSGEVVAKALLRRRGQAPWGLEVEPAPRKLLVIRAGSLGLTRQLVERLQERFPEAAITVLAPESRAEETRLEVEAPVIVAAGTGLVSYQLSRSLARELRAKQFDAVYVAGEGNRRAEGLALLTRVRRKLEVREDGAAHRFWLAPDKPLTALPLCVLARLRRAYLGLVLWLVRGSIRLESSRWRRSHRPQRG